MKKPFQNLSKTLLQERFMQGFLKVKKKRFMNVFNKAVYDISIEKLGTIQLRCIG